MEFDIKKMMMLKALNNPKRREITKLIVNSSPIAFTTIQKHLEKQKGAKITKGTLAYHLDLLIEGKILEKTMEREGRQYSFYNITPEAKTILQELEVLIPIK